MLHELHITCYAKDEIMAAEIAAICKWKTSKIAGDPQLGKDTYFYLTTYADDLDSANLKLNACIAELIYADVKPIRGKIEQIVYDVRY